MVNGVFVKSEDLIDVGDTVCIKEYPYEGEEGEVIFIDEVGYLHIFYGEKDVLVLSKDSVKKIK